jgi:hypothetical protein
MFRERYVEFLNELSKLAKTHDELTDTDVREEAVKVGAKRHAMLEELRHEARASLLEDN